MAKKIKSFTVDEDTYNALIQMFKKYEVDVSISSYVNSCLKQLLEGLQETEQYLKEGKGYSVPMSYIINEIVTSKAIMPDYDKDWPEEMPPRLEVELDQWQDEYDAKRKKLPIGLYKLTKDSSFTLSDDKNYAISKVTGQKFRVLEYHPIGQFTLEEIKDSEEMKEKKGKKK
jgi:hypothetical protein